MRRAICAAAFLGWGPILCCAEKRPDKSGYTLFRPVPDSLMREMETDRPDKTESAYTVDAGHFQIEMDILGYTRDHTKDQRTESFGIASTNFKMGVVNHIDLQLVVESFNILETTDRGTGMHSRVSGYGDLTLRSKINLWGDDGGPTALSVMPFVKLPTAKHDLGNGAVEGGVIFPFAMELPCE